MASYGGPWPAMAGKLAMVSIWPVSVSHGQPWLSLAAFSSVAPDVHGAQLSQSMGYALRPHGWLGLWRAALSEKGQPEAFELLGHAELGECSCAAPLTRPLSTAKGLVGQVVSCSPDGSVRLWELSYTAPGSFALAAMTCGSPVAHWSPDITLARLSRRSAP